MTIANVPTFELYSSQKNKRERKCMRIFLNRVQLEISPTQKRKYTMSCAIFNCAQFFVLPTKKHKEPHTR